MMQYGEDEEPKVPKDMDDGESLELSSADPQATLTQINQYICNGETYTLAGFGTITRNDDMIEMPYAPKQIALLSLISTNPATTLTPSALLTTSPFYIARKTPLWYSSSRPWCGYRE